MGKECVLEKPGIMKNQRMIYSEMDYWDAREIQGIPWVNSDSALDAGHTEVFYFQIFIQAV